ncbi:hypothetical protein GEK51_09480 [Lacticaseibacillus rhamnosus]|nr:hypothetical protein GEK51_09480 [Lacticaseibacillus rhamnosus]
MAGFWPLRLRSLHAGFCAGERVMGISQNFSSLKRDGPFHLYPATLLKPKSIRHKQSIICRQPLIQNMNELIMLI